MTRTYLVAIDQEPMADSDSIAADMLDSLAQDGFQVTSVKPWASANTDPVDPFMSLQLPEAPANFLG